MTIIEDWSRELSRRALLTGAGPAAVAIMLPGRAEAGAHLVRIPKEKQYPLFDEATANVIPVTGYQSKVALMDCVHKLVRYQVVSRDKYRALQGATGRAPDELAILTRTPSRNPIHLTRENASHYVNLLWGVGLANRLDANKDSPIAGKDLTNFASTGGWTLGMAPEGSVYFNRFPIIELKPDAEALAVRVAKLTFRPCCNNSTFFQDCNHGSALFAVLQLGAAQGLGEDQLYKEALAFNSFWFPDYYIATALYFKTVHKTEWRDVDAKTVMSAEFSSGSGWQKNALLPLQAFPDLFPPPSTGANCGT